MHHMIRIALTGIIALASSPAAFAQFDSLPSGELDLRMEGLNDQYGMYIEYDSLTWSDGTAWFWGLQVVPMSVGDFAAWSVQAIDCTARTSSISEKFAVKADGTLIDTFGEIRENTEITPDSMDESLFQVLCEEKSFDLGQPPVKSVGAAMTQGRNELKDRFDRE